MSKQIGIFINSSISHSNWGLTFDDGPTTNTPALLDILKLTNSKTTFFVVGSRVVQNPLILKRAYLEGHQIGYYLLLLLIVIIIINNYYY